MKRSDMNHLRRLLGWANRQIGDVTPPTSPAATGATYASRLLSAMEFRDVGVAELASAMGTTYQCVKRVTEARSKTFSTANNEKAALALGISPRWLATGAGTMEADNIGTIEAIRDALKALGKLLPDAGRDPGAEGLRNVAETRASVGPAPGADAGHESALNDVQVETGLAEIGIHAWGPRAEDWLAGAEYAARHHLRGNPHSLAAERGESDASAAPQPLQNHPNAATNGVACRDTPAEPPTLRREGMPELTSGLINDACWKFVAAMPHKLPVPIWNDLKPAIYAAICHVLADRQQPAVDTAYIAQLRAALILARDSHGVSLLTDPPQDAWKARHVNEVIRAALAAGLGEGAGGRTC